MSKRQHKTPSKVCRVDIKQNIHQSLRKDFACTEEQIDLIDRALRRQAPAHVVDHLQRIHEGKVSLPEMGTLLLDFEDGREPQAIKMTNHPLNLLLIYLTEIYGQKFGNLYWAAITPPHDPKDFYDFLKVARKLPFMKKLAESSEGM